MSGLEFCSAEQEEPAQQVQRVASKGCCSLSWRAQSEGGCAGQARRVEDYCVARWRQQGLKV